MHNPFDQLAKKVGKEALSASGPTITQYEISRDAQQADIRHDPDPSKGAERALLGLLGRIAAILCLIDIFGHPLSGVDLRASMSRHLAHWTETVLKRKALNKRLRAKGLPPEPVVEPLLWLITTTLSSPMKSKIGARHAKGWPSGVYEHGADVYRVMIVAADELPREQSTILVRIMAAGPGLPAAIEDLAALPPGAHERTVAEQILTHLQDQLARKSTKSPEEEEFIKNMQSTWEKARQIGRAEANAHAVLAVLRARQISVSEADRERILAEQNSRRLEQWLERAAVATSISEVFKARSRA